MIGFTAPWALLGLFVAALPILLHLAQKREPPEISFPAVRYLDDTTKEHRRRLKLRHWLLLAVRTLLIVLLVLAAAGMTLRRARVGGHPPSAMVLVLDNSASSSAMVDGTPLLERLTASARAVLGHATNADRLWLVTADGVARTGSAGELQAQLAALVSTAGRLDLGVAISEGRNLTRATGLPGEVVLVTDLQQSALGAAAGAGDVLVLHPVMATLPNRGILRVEPEAQPWGLAGGDVRITLTASDTTPIPVTVSLGGDRGAHREVLLTPGVPATVHLESRQPGWNVLTVSIPPDELRADDMQIMAVQVAPPTVVRWNPADRFIDAAFQVLASDRRVIPGNGVSFGTLASGPSIVLPPEDPAQIGGINRALAARGVSWQYGTVIEAAAVTDSGTLLTMPVAVNKRVTLRSTGATGEVFANVQGEPWMVRGADVVLFGSRLDMSWTELPTAAGFVPLLDALVTRVIRGAAVIPPVSAGAPFTIPARVTDVAHNGVTTRVEGGAPWRAGEAGIYHLMSGADTVGSVAAQIDPRESALEAATPSEVESLWPDATIASLDEGPGYAFGMGRGDIRKSLLLLAFICVIAETVLARRGMGMLR